MAYGRVTVATYLSAAEAAWAQGLLSEEGIAALVSTADGASLWGGVTSGGVAGVCLEVDAQDAERATAVLRQYKAENDDEAEDEDDDEGVASEWDAPSSWDDAEDVPGEVWICPTCSQDVDIDASVCWSCGTTIDGVANPDFVRVEESQNEEALEALEDGLALSRRNQLVDRAWTQAVIGVWLLPPVFLIVALFTLADASATPGALTDRSEKRMSQTRWICFVWGTLTALFWIRRFSRG